MAYARGPTQPAHLRGQFRASSSRFVISGRALTKQRPTGCHDSSQTSFRAACISPEQSCWRKLPVPKNSAAQNHPEPHTSPCTTHLPNNCENKEAEWCLTRDIRHHQVPPRDELHSTCIASSWCSSQHGAGNLRRNNAGGKDAAPELSPESTKSGFRVVAYCQIVILN